MQRTAILNGSNINFDKDYSLTAVALMEPGVVEGLQVTENSVAPGKAFILVERTATTPSESFYIVYENTTAVTIDTSGTKKVFVRIPKVNINDPAYNSTSQNIAVIETGDDYPTEDYIPLASITAGVITDARVFIKLKKAVLDLLALTQDIETSGDITANKFHGDGSLLTGLSAEVKSTSLRYMAGKSGIIGRAYSLQDYEQTDYDTEVNIGTSTQPQIAQSFFAQEINLDEIKVMLRTQGSPDDGVYIEIQTDNAGAPSGTAVTNGTSNTIAYGDIAGTLTEESFTFATAPTLTSETKYWIVVKRTGGNSDVNYYVLGSAGSDAILGNLATNNGTAWSDQVNDLYFIITGYKIAVLGGVNFIGISQESATVGSYMKLNTSYDQNQTGLVPGNYYGYNLTTGEIITGGSFEAISETELFLQKVKNENLSKRTELKLGENVSQKDCLVLVSIGDAEIDQTNTSGTNDAGVYTTGWLGQTFTTGSGVDNIIKAEVKIYREGTIGDVTLEVRATSGGVPTGSALGSKTLDLSTLTTDTNGTLIDFTFDTPISLSESTQYAIILIWRGGNSTNEIRWKRSDTSVYAGGSRVDTADSGSTWTANTSQDFVFNTYIQLATDGNIIKSDASNTLKINFYGFAGSDGISGDTLNAIFEGVTGGFTGLTIGVDYYMSDTPGVISDTPGTNEKKIGKAVSTTELLIER